MSIRDTLRTSLRRTSTEGCKLVVLRWIPEKISFWSQAGQICIKLLTLDNLLNVSHTWFSFLYQKKKKVVTLTCWVVVKFWRKICRPPTPFACRSESLSSMEDVSILTLSVGCACKILFTEIVISDLNRKPHLKWKFTKS